MGCGWSDSAGAIITMVKQSLSLATANKGGLKMWSYLLSVKFGLVIVALNFFKLLSIVWGAISNTWKQSVLSEFFFNLAAPRFFNPLLVVWKSDKTLFENPRIWHIKSEIISLLATVSISSFRPQNFSPGRRKRSSVLIKEKQMALLFFRSGG